MFAIRRGTRRVVEMLNAGTPCDYGVRQTENQSFRTTDNALEESWTLHFIEDELNFRVRLCKLFIRVFYTFDEAFLGNGIPNLYKFDKYFPCEKSTFYIAYTISLRFHYHEKTRKYLTISKSESLTILYRFQSLFWNALFVIS